MSTVDYPAEVASVIYIMGCNLRCPFCHNPTIVKKEEAPLNEEAVLDAIRKNGSVIDGVVITGGEPTIYGNRLLELILRIRNANEGYKIKLDTNGLRQDVLKKAIPYVDYIAMDVKTSFSHYADLGLGDLRQNVDYRELGRSIETLNLLPKGTVEYRHTCVNPFTEWLIEDFPAELRETCHPFYLQKANLNDVLNLTFEMHAVDPLEVKGRLDSLKYPKDVRMRVG